MSGRYWGAIFFAIVGTFVLASLAGLLFLANPRSTPASRSTADAPIEEHGWFDEVYLKALGGPVLTATSDGEISMGRRSCSALAEGRSSTEVRQVLEARGLSSAQAVRVVLAAVTAYCPEYAHAVNP